MVVKIKTIHENNVKQRSIHKISKNQFVASYQNGPDDNDIKAHTSTIEFIEPNTFDRKINNIYLNKSLLVAKHQKNINTCYSQICFKRFTCDILLVKGEFHALIQAYNF